MEYKELLGNMRVLWFGYGSWCVCVCACMQSLHHDLCDWPWEATGLGGRLCYMHWDSFIGQIFSEHLSCRSTVLGPGNTAVNKPGKNFCRHGTYILTKQLKALLKAWLWGSKFLPFSVCFQWWILQQFPLLKAQKHQHSNWCKECNHSVSPF